MLLNALDKSAKVAIVNSPFLNEVMISSLNLTSNFDVDCFLLKPDYVGLYNSWF